MTGRPAVVVEAVSHRYGGTLALDGVSLTFEPGTETAIIGPDGVGKSTLLGLIAGVRALQQGDVAAFGASHRPTDPGAGS